MSLAFFNICMLGYGTLGIGSLEYLRCEVELTLSSFLSKRFLFLQFSDVFSKFLLDWLRQEHPSTRHECSMALLPRRPHRHAHVGMRQKDTRRMRIC